MRRLTLLVIAAAMLSGSSAAAQSAPPDTLVGKWLTAGRFSGWIPSLLLEDCRPTSPWQDRDIAYLAQAKLSHDRLEELAISWGAVLRCGDPRIEQWFFREISAGVRRGDSTMKLELLWEGLRRGDSPAIRAFLRGILLDRGTPAASRERSFSSDTVPKSASRSKSTCSTPLVFPTSSSVGRRS